MTASLSLDSLKNIKVRSKLYIYVTKDMYQSFPVEDKGRVTLSPGEHREDNTIPKRGGRGNTIPRRGGGRVKLF